MFAPFLKFYITTSLFSTLPNIPWFNLFFYWNRYYVVLPFYIFFKWECGQKCSTVNNKLLFKKQTTTSPRLKVKSCGFYHTQILPLSSDCFIGCFKRILSLIQRVFVNSRNSRKTPCIFYISKYLRTSFPSVQSKKATKWSCIYEKWS